MYALVSYLGSLFASLTTVIPGIYISAEARKLKCTNKRLGDSAMFLVVSSMLYSFLTLGFYLFECKKGVWERLMKKPSMLVSVYLFNFVFGFLFMSVSATILTEAKKSKLCNQKKLKYAATMAWAAGVLLMLLTVLHFLKCSQRLPFKLPFRLPLVKDCGKK